MQQNHVPVIREISLRNNGEETLKDIRIIVRFDPEFAQGTEATKCARYWGHITFPDGRRENFSRQRGGEIARSTGFAVTDERKLYKKLGDSYLLPYQR